MLFRLPLILTAAAALSACVMQPPAGTATGPAPAIQIPAVPGQDNAARGDARLAINRALAARMPGANVAPYTTCVVSTATSAEIAEIGRTSQAGGNVNDAVAAIVTRPATRQCIQNAATEARRGTV